MPRSMARNSFASKSFDMYSLASKFTIEVLRLRLFHLLLIVIGRFRPRQVSVTTAMGAALRRIQLGNALSAFGNGFTVPFLFVYVTQVRDLGASTAGMVL